MAIPGSKHACPIIAACWSPAIPAIGIDPPNIPVAPNTPAQSHTSGSIAAGTPNSASIAGSQAPARMSYSIVRLALVASVRCTRPSVSRHNSQVSTVPNASRPASASARAPGTLSRIQAILVALK